MAPQSGQHVLGQTGCAAVTACACGGYPAVAMVIVGTEEPVATTNMQQSQGAPSQHTALQHSTSVGTDPTALDLRLMLLARN